MSYVACFIPLEDNVAVAIIACSPLNVSEVKPLNPEIRFLVNPSISF